MNNEEDKIVLDDISFDDMLDEGVSVESPVEAPDLDVREEESPAEEELNTDAENKSEISEDTPEVEEPEAKEEDTPDEDLENSIVGQILETLGYDADDNYDDTTEGLLKLTQDVGGKMAEDQLDQLFEKFPLVKTHLEYVLNGGDSQNFMQAYDPNQDYGKMEISEDDTRSQKAILSDYFSSKGHDKDFIDELLGDYEDTGKLYQKSQAAKSSLAQSQGHERQRFIENQKSQKATSAKEQQKFWNGVHDTIENSTEFAGLTVPKREKSKFFDYLSRPINNEGHTQRDLDHSSADMEVKLAIDYLMYKGFDLNSIINTKAKTKATKSLRERISKNEDSIKSARKASRRSSGSVDLENLDLNF